MHKESRKHWIGELALLSLLSARFASGACYYASSNLSSTPAAGCDTPAAHAQKSLRMMPFAAWRSIRLKL